MRLKAAFIFLAISAQQSSAEELIAGNWKGESEISALTDKSSMTWTNRATNDVSNSIGRGEAPWFVVRCQDNQTDAFFVLNNYMGSEQQQLLYRIDGGQVRKRAAAPSDDGRAIGFWGPASTGFLMQLTGVKELVVAAKPYQSVQVEGVFDIDGIEQVIAGIKKTCNW